MLTLVNTPFPSRDTFTYGVGFLDTRDLGRLAKVSRNCTLALQNPDIWKKVFTREGVPLVSGPSRNLRDDFRILYPITISGRMISQFLGQVVGEVPSIHVSWFDKLMQDDCHEKGKKIADTFVFVVKPDYVTRLVDKNTPFTLDESGSLVEDSTGASEELNIPLTKTNLQVLCKYPLQGTGFTLNDQHSFVTNEAPKFEVYFMRKQMLGAGKKSSYGQEKRIASSMGLEVAPPVVRLLADSIFILKSRTCPDSEAVARTSQRIIVNAGERVSLGIQFDALSNQLMILPVFANDNTAGVVIGGPADVSNPLTVMK